MQLLRYLCLPALIFSNLTIGLSQKTYSPESVIQAWETMWNTYNLTEVDRLFVTDRSVTYFSSEYEGLIQGIDALRNHHAKFGFINGGKQTGNKLWLENTHYEYSDRSCIVTATWYFQRQGSDQHQSGPVTFVLVNTKRAWRIKHAHFSNNP